MGLTTAEIVLIAVVSVVVVLLIAHFAYHRMHDPFAKERREAMANIQDIERQDGTRIRATNGGVAWISPW